MTLARLLAGAALCAAAALSHAAERFPVLTKDQLTPEQSRYVAALLAGPRGGDDRDSPEAVRRMMERGPFNAWARSPELGMRLQNVGEYIRYGTSIPFRLNEFAILITARVWTSQYEWFAHYPLAMKAGLDPKIAEQLRMGKRPEGMPEEEAIVYDFCTELHRDRNVTDATFARAKKAFGDKGVMDLIGVSGYYTAVSMTLNVGNSALPKGEPDPLPPLR